MLDRGGVNLRVSAADIKYKQLGAGDAIKTDGTKYAIQFYKLYSGSQNFKNCFLGNLGVYSNSTYVITLATKATGGSSVTDIETIIEREMQAHDVIQNPDLETILEVDAKYKSRKYEV